MFGECTQTVDYASLSDEGFEIEYMSEDQIEAFASEHIGRPIVIVGAATGTDTHSVGIDAMLNLKGFHGHHGLEGYKAFETHNLGSQVPNSVLIARAIDLNADAILVSQTVTQQNLHVSNLTELVEIVEAEGRRKQMILTCGGPRVSNELAKELGYDAGFSRAPIRTTWRASSCASWPRAWRSRRSRSKYGAEGALERGWMRRPARLSDLLAGRAARAGRAREEHRQDRDARGDPERARGRQHAVGVTSIGRDGEEHDVIDARIDKPRIVLQAGGLVASTGALLRASGVAHERLAQTGVRTPLGEVVIAKARGAGRDRSGRSERRRGMREVSERDDRTRRRAGADRRRDRPPRSLLAGSRRRARDGHRRGARRGHRGGRGEDEGRGRSRRLPAAGRATVKAGSGDGDGDEAGDHAGAPTRAERRAGGDRRRC